MYIIQTFLTTQTTCLVFWLLKYNNIMAQKIFGNLIICPFKASIQHNFISRLFLTLHQTVSKCELARPHCTASINSGINTDYSILQNINLNKRVYFTFHYWLFSQFLEVRKYQTNIKMFQQSNFCWLTYIISDLCNISGGGGGGVTLLVNYIHNPRLNH